MRSGEARRWVEAHFGTMRRFEASERKNVPDDEFAAALEHLDYLPSSREKDQTALELFLYAGRKRFDRWFAPSPPSVSPGYRDLLKRFAEALKARERFPMNAPVLVVHSLRDDLYAALTAKALPLDADTLTLLDGFKRHLGDVAIPETPAKRNEVLSAKDELNAIIDGLCSGSLRSRLRTTLPYPLTRQPLTLYLAWEGLGVTARMNSHFAAPPNFLTQTAQPNVLRPLNTTRW